MSYNSKYTGSQVETLLEKAESITIPDLSEYAKMSDLADKVDKVDGKQLSTEDFTTSLKTKLEGLVNYDDTTISEAVETLRNDFDTLVSGDTTTAIKTFNEIIAFLDGIEDSQSLDSIIASIEQQIADIQTSIPTKTSDLTNDSGFLTEHQNINHLATKDELQQKQDSITDLDSIRFGAALGATALQEHQDISGKKDKAFVQTITEESLSLSISPNTVYNCTTALTNLTISSFSITSEVYEEYTMLFKSNDTTTLTLPSDVYWANGEIPQIEADTEYELSITKRTIGDSNIFKAILVPFKTVT